MTKTTDSLAAVIAWLADHPHWPADVELHGLELPAGWQPKPTLLVLPDGGSRGLDLPVIYEALSCWCYGATAEAGRAVADAVCGLVHRSAVTKITVSGAEVYVGPGEILTEPVYLREPQTFWHRWIVRLRMRVSELPMEQVIVPV